MEFEIHGRKIGENHPVFFIAEAGVNHNGSLDLAKQLVDVAKEARADAVKFQTFKTENIIVPDAPKSTYHVETTGLEQSWFDLLKTQELSREMHEQLIDYCRRKEIIFLSTPYDEESADLLEEVDVPAFKIASTDTNNIPFVRYVAQKGKPMIISTAMCEMEEVEQAVNAIREEGLQEFVVLQCTGNYPTRLEDSNLRVIEMYRRKLNCLVGYSDHTAELINPIAATALGTSVYEKHFTIDKELPGPDHRMSLSPDELKETIRLIRQTEQALGSRQKGVLESEKGNRLMLRKSLVAATNISKGTEITREMIAIKRPGKGISPSRLDNFIGRKILIDVSKDVILDETMFG